MAGKVSQDRMHVFLSSFLWQLLSSFPSNILGAAKEGKKMKDIQKAAKQRHFLYYFLYYCGRCLLAVSESS